MYMLWLIAVAFRLVIVVTLYHDTYINVSGIYNGKHIQSANGTYSGKVGDFRSWLLSGPCWCFSGEVAPLLGDRVVLVCPPRPF